MTDNTLKLGPGDDLQMMKTPDAWPHRFLPLTRRTEKAESGALAKELGIMVMHRDVPRTRVYLTHMFDARLRRLVRHGTEADIPFKDYPDFEGILNDGWLVD